MPENRFAGVPRGAALRGTSRIADYVFTDPEAADLAANLPRDEYGLLRIGRELIGFTGWIDFALAEEARTAKSRRPKRRAPKQTEAA
jgi:hypothetical protein